MDLNLDPIKLLDKLFSVLKEALPYISTIFLASWGGTVAYIQRLKIKTRPFSYKELLYDIIISSFAGYLTYLFCLYAGVPGPVASLLIAISGHMGARALAKFERLRDTILGFKDDERI